MRKAIILLLLLFLPFWATPCAVAKDLRMAVSLSLPPFVFPETDSGIDLEIVKEALKLKGYTVKPIYVVYGRTAVDLKTGKVDGACTVSAKRGLENVYLSNDYICYQNVAISLRSKGYRLDSVKDLKDKRVIAFQDASKLLGPEFAEVAKAGSSYYEIPDQESQVALLFKERTDVIVMDVNIFKYYQKHTKRADTSPPVDIFALFPPSCYCAGFLDRKVRDDFNEGLKELRASGRYEEIFKKYLE